MTLLRPNPLPPGSTIAVVSMSWGGPAAFPAIFDSGLANLRALGYEIKEYPSARTPAADLFRDPEFRARDLNAAFADPEVDGILSSIGGNDSVRILRHLDLEVIRANPKLFVGYSDVTTINTWLNQNGLTTFNGPSVMAGFSQLQSFPELYRKYLGDFLQGRTGTGPWPSFEAYSNGYPDWARSENIGKRLPEKPADGWRWLQGRTPVQGRLFGGCLEVLEMMKGTDFWPAKEFWDGRILFLETSEEKPPVSYIKYALRNYGVMGVFDRISALLFSRARDYTDEEKITLDKTIQGVVRDEFGQPDLPIVTNMDFGHTDPQLVLPLGVLTEVDPGRRQIRFLEPVFAGSVKS